MLNLLRWPRARLRASKAKFPAQDNPSHVLDWALAGANTMPPLSAPPGDPSVTWSSLTVPCSARAQYSAADQHTTISSRCRGWNLRRSREASCEVTERVRMEVPSGSYRGQAGTSTAGGICKTADYCNGETFRSGVDARSTCRQEAISR